MESLLYDRLALLAHKLPDIMRPECTLAARTRRFPAANRLHPRPRARRRAATTIAIHDASFDLRKEFPLLGFVIGENSRGQAVIRSIRKVDRLIKRLDAFHRQHRREKFFLKHPRSHWQSGHN